MSSYALTAIFRSSGRQRKARSGLNGMILQSMNHRVPVPLHTNYGELGKATANMCPFVVIHIAVTRSYWGVTLFSDEVGIVGVPR